MNKWLEQKLKSWNQRNTNYYKKAFRDLDQKNQTTFNNMACLFPVAWLIYRKMYSWCAAYLILNTSLSLGLIGFKSGFATIFLLIVSIAIMVIFGRFGNSIYYETVKYRVSKGYHRMNDYSSINPI